MDAHGPPFQVRSLALPVYLPNLLFSVGQGAVIPMIALLALDLGASAPLAGAIVALRAVGSVVFDVPAGLLVARLGERRAMVVATLVLAATGVGIGLRPPLPVYAGLVFVTGCFWSVFLLARLAFATEASPLGHRGRVMAMIGGVQRIGFLVGPLIGGALVVPLGLAGPFYLQTVMAIACTVSLLTATGESESPDDAEGPGQTVTLRSTFFDHRRSLATAGMAIIVMQILRSAREAVVPLWGAAIGLTASQVSFLFALTSGVEVVLFYPPGLLMDRKGRKWAAIPCMAMLAVSMAMVPLTSDMSSLTWVVVVMGLANGLGSGINMTLGSDLSPARGRSEFFGLWRLITDTGTASGPLLVAAVTSAASLGAASVLVGGVGVVGVALLWLAVPETLVQRAGGPHGV